MPEGIEGYYLEQHLASSTISTPEDYVLYRRRLLRWLPDREMSEWVDPDFYTMPTLTDVILRPCTPLSSDRKLLFAATLVRAIASSALPITTALAEMLQTLEKGTESRIGGQRIESVDTNLLNRLPPELILDVADHLDLTDLLALRACCKQVYDLLHRPSEKILRDTIAKEGSTITFSYYIASDPFRLLAVRDEVAIRFHRDRYRQLAFSEVFARTLYGMENTRALCNFCLDLHAVAAFSSTELVKGPYERQCIGAAAGVRLCDHKHLQFKDIINMRQHYKKGRWRGKIFCEEGRCAPPTRLICFPSGKVFATPFISTMFDRYSLTRHFYVFLPQTTTEHNRTAITVATEILGLMVELDEYICPYLRTSSPEISGALMDSMREGMTSSTTLAEDELWSLEVHAKCTTGTCGVWCNAVIYVMEKALRIYIGRNLSVHLVTDPRWLEKLDTTTTEAENTLTAEKMHSNRT